MWNHFHLKILHYSVLSVGFHDHTVLEIKQKRSSNSADRLTSSTPTLCTFSYLIDGSDMVMMKKCTEIWAVFDEIQDELKGTMI